MIVHGNTFAGKVGNAGFSEVADGEVDFFPDAFIETAVDAESVISAFAIADEFLENFVEVGRA